MVYDIQLVNGRYNVPWGLYPDGSQTIREQELDFLKRQAQAYRVELETLGAKIWELESELLKG